MGNKIVDERKTYKQGMISAIGCSLWWGIMPIYWQMLRPIDSAVIIFYRIVLVAVVCLIGALILYDKDTILAPLKDKKKLVRIVLAGCLITANWSLYIWAVNANLIIQTCIGYYIEPLAVCLIGIIIFKDKLSKYKAIAFGFAAAGVIAVIVYFGELPVLALSLALTFSFYAALKKDFNMPPILSLLYETIFLMPFALGVIIYIETTGQGALAVAEPYKYALLMLCGLFTAFPLGLFADAANKLNLFVLGLTEYISPTISLFIGIKFLGEPFEPIQLIAFAIIWVGLVFFSYGEYLEVKQHKEPMDNEGK
ncbi:MAG: EamA family transporter RarD [Firmicutes bacterium]|nr:EamA family transporter RarD [Bacillota bacterium]